LPATFEHMRGSTSVLQVNPPAVQFAQAAPPDPHAPFVKPSAQALLVVQQPAQLPGPQRG